MTYEFDAQVALEEQHKNRYIKLLEGNGYVIEELPDVPIQRLGVDALIRTDDWRHSIEFKTDFQAHRTGNFFVETVSNDSENKPGWAYTSTAQLLGLFISNRGRLLLIPMWEIKLNLPRWIATYPTRSCQNPTYRSHGVLVPLTQLESISGRILEEEGPEDGEEILPSARQAQDQEDPPRRQDGRSPARGRHRRVRAQRQIHPQAQIRG